MTSGYQIAYDVLGPIFRFFCYRLRLVEQYKEDVPFLFLSRGGLRLRHYYERYLAANRLPKIAPHHDFYVSRVSALRALLSKRPEIAAEAIAGEYTRTKTSTAMRYFLPKELHAQWREQALAAGTELEQEFTANILLDLLADPGSHGELLRQHVRDQHALLTEHFGSLCNGQPEVILVDTGWSGSIINSLNLLFPSISMTAVFLGRSNFGKPVPPWYGLISGLIFQDEFYTPWRPQSALVYYRHLIESLCEPEWPSVAYFVRKNGVAQPSLGEIPKSLIAPGESEPVARGVGDFINRETVESPQEVTREYLVAIKRLARILTYPSVREAKALGMSPRSLDFGQDFSSLTLLDKDHEKSRLIRVRRALWHQGQAALEFRSLRVPIQLALTWWHLPKRILRVLGRSR